MLPNAVQGIDFVETINEQRLEHPQDQIIATALEEQASNIQSMRHLLEAQHVDALIHAVRRLATNASVDCSTFSAWIQSFAMMYSEPKKIITYSWTKKT